MLLPSNVHWLISPTPWSSSQTAEVDSGNLDGEKKSPWAGEKAGTVDQINNTNWRKRKVINSGFEPILTQPLKKVSASQGTWVAQLVNVWLLISAQVMISPSWIWALECLAGAWDFLFPSFSLHLPHVRARALSLSLSLCLSNKLKKNKKGVDLVSHCPHSGWLLNGISHGGLLSIYFALNSKVIWV